jgi:hypothetical protein
MIIGGGHAGAPGFQQPCETMDFPVRAAGLTQLTRFKDQHFLKKAIVTSTLRMHSLFDPSRSYYMFNGE